MSEQDKSDAGIASRSQNEALEHVEGGTTTRRDATDVGVPMIAGSPDEPIGPEDALGAGPKRGDYSQRIGPDNYHPTISVPVRDAEEGQPNVEIVAQRPFASEQGDAPGKGGVSTEEAVAFRRGGEPRPAATRIGSADSTRQAAPRQAASPDQGRKPS